MQVHLREDKVLKFKVLTMHYRILGQLREVKPDELEGKGKEKFIGWVLCGLTKYWIGQAYETLVRVSRNNILEWIATERGLDVFSQVYLEKRADDMRNSIPQIFLKG